MNLLEQIDFNNLNWPALLMRAEEELRKLTGENLKENEIRVSQLYDSIIQYNNQNPTSKIKIIKTVKVNGQPQTVDLVSSLENFRNIFFYKELMKPLWVGIWQKKVTPPKANNISIPNDFTVFVRQYGLKKKPKLDGFAGVYRDDETYDFYNVVAEDDELYIRELLGKVPLTADGDNFKSADGRYYLKFIKDADGKVTGGKFRIRKDGIEYEHNVTKISEGDGGGGGGEEKIKDDVWKCINVFLNDNNYILLSYKVNKPQTWIAIGGTVNGEKTELAFDEDYTAYHRTREGEKIIKKGKWECTDNGTSFIIKWDNGKVYDPKETLGDAGVDGDKNSDEQGTGETDVKRKVKSNIKPCKNYSNAPTAKEILSGKKNLTKCMKGPVVLQIQDMPVFQSYLFDVLRGNGEIESTDNMFGPYMEKAVKIYQSTNGLYTLNVDLSGTIDKKTYELLLRQNQNRPGPGPEPPKPPTPTPTPSPAPEPPKPQFSNQKTKF